MLLYRAKIRTKIREQAFPVIRNRLWVNALLQINIRNWARQGSFGLEGGQLQKRGLPGSWQQNLVYIILRPLINNLRADPQKL